jgi:recombinational DNA repair protein (RecF pathway)
VLAEKGGRYTVVSAYLYESFFSLRLDIEAFYAACAAAETCRTIALENEEYDGLFIAFAECLKSLSLSEEERGEALITFLLVALRESGYPIDLDFSDAEEIDKLYFDFSEGRFSSIEQLVSGERASLSTYHVLRKCAGLSYREELTSGGRKRAWRLLKAFIGEKTEATFDNLNEFIKLYEEI